MEPEIENPVIHPVMSSIVASVAAAERPWLHSIPS
jgi:hypothetical protein